MFHTGRTSRALVVAAFATALASVAPAAAVQAAAPAGDAVLQAEEARLRAEVAHDTVQLDRLVATDLWYVHANGRTQDRAAYLAAIAKAESPVYDAHLAERSVATDGRTAVTHGTVDYLVRIDARPRRARYTAAYRRERGQWRLVAWQNTAVPDAR